MDNLEKELEQSKKARKAGLPVQWFTARNWSVRYLAAESEAERVKLRQELTARKLTFHEIIFLCEAFVRLDESIIAILSMKEYDGVHTHEDIFEAIRLDDLVGYLRDYRKALELKNRTQAGK